MSEAKFVDGFFVKDKHPNAPDFVICKISMKKAEVAAWLQAWDEEWVNLDVKRSKDGKLYAQIDEWKPQTGSKADSQDVALDDVPF